jgi:hypothetical protein
LRVDVVEWRNGDDEQVQVGLGEKRRRARDQVGLEPKNFHSIINQSHLFSTTVSLLQLSPPSSQDS